MWLLTGKQNHAKRLLSQCQCRRFCVDEIQNSIVFTFSDGHMCPKNLLVVIAVPWHSHPKHNLLFIFVRIRRAKTTNVIYADEHSSGIATWLGNLKIVFTLWTRTAGSNENSLAKCYRHHNRVHRDNRTTANSIATINSVASGEMGSSMNANSETGNVYDTSGAQVCDLR